MSAYNKFAQLYDDLMYDCDYDKWSQYLIDAVKSIKSDAKCGCDLACGSGRMTVALKEAGCDVFGVDLSNEMLNRAKELSKSRGYKIDFICADMISAELKGNLDFVIICMAVSYISQKQIKKLFENVSKSLKKGGAFVFDISSEYKIRDYIGDNVFYEDSDEVTYLWTNKQTKTGVTMNLAFFLPSDGKYERFDEEHILYAHETDTIIKELTDVGFTDIKTYGDIDFSKVKKNSMRINFVCKKA